MLEYSFCMVNWNGGQTFLRSVESVLEGLGGLDAEIVIVDNGSTDGSPELLPADDRIRLIRNKANEYFAKATNQSVANARGKRLAILNNDVIFQGNSLRFYAEAASNRPNDIICPRLANEDGSAQLSIRNVLTPLLFLNESFRLSKRTALRWILEDFNFNKEQAVEQPLFSLLFMSKDTFARVGPMDERFPLLFNDVDWFKRAKEAGVRTTYIPGPPVLHKHGYSTNKHPMKKVMMSTISMVAYFQKHYPLGSLPLLPLIAASGIARIARMVWETSRRL